MGNADADSRKKYAVALLAERGPGFGVWLKGPSGSRLNAEDLLGLLAQAVDLVHATAFRLLVQVIQEHGVSLDRMARAYTPEQEKWVHGSVINPFWRESLFHRGLAACGEEGDLPRLDFVEALLGAGFCPITDIAKNGDTVLHSLLQTSTFFFHSATPSARMRNDGVVIGLRLRAAGLDVDCPNHEGKSVRQLAAAVLPELAAAFRAEDAAAQWECSLPPGKSPISSRF